MIVGNVVAVPFLPIQHLAQLYIYQCLAVSGFYILQSFLQQFHTFTSSCQFVKTSCHIQVVFRKVNGAEVGISRLNSFSVQCFRFHIIPLNVIEIGGGGVE